MSKKSYKSIRNGAIASFIAGIAILEISNIKKYTNNFIDWIWVKMLSFLEATFTSYPIRGWILLILSILAFIGLLNIYLKIRGKIKEEEYKSYTQDLIHNIKWRWSWKSNMISDLWCYCPHCDATLVYDDRPDFYDALPKKTKFICENCNNKVIGIIDGSKNYAISTVEREIDRRVRIEEYKKK